MVIDKISNVVLLVTCVFMVFIPGELNVFFYMLIPIFVVYGLYLLFELNTYKGLSLEVVLWTGAVVLVGLFGCLVGVLGDASLSGTIESLFIYVVYPTIFLILIYISSSIRDISDFSRNIYYLAILIAFLVVWSKEFVGISVVRLDADALDRYSSSANLDITFEFVVYIEKMIGFLSFFGPYAIVYGILNLPSKKPWLSIVNLLSILLVVYAMLISERKMMVFVVVLLLVIWMAWEVIKIIKDGFQGRDALYISMLVVSIIFSFIIDDNLFASYGNNILKQISYSYSSPERVNQIDALIDTANSHPLIGSGLGTSAIGFIRSNEKPWHYEYTYLKLLFQVGLLGLSVYSLSIFWVAFRLYKVSLISAKHRTLSLPYLLGLVGIVIAATSNPYFDSFKAMIMIILPILVLNWHMKHPFISSLDYKKFDSRH